jgi:hypothetical protein
MKVPARVLVPPSIYLALCLAVAIQIIPSEGSWIQRLYRIAFTTYSPAHFR